MHKKSTKKNGKINKDGFWGEEAAVMSGWEKRRKNE
jgi:allantoicase